MLRVSSVRSAGHWALLSTTDFWHVIQSSRAINLYWNWKWTCLKWLLESIFAIPGTFLKLKQVKYINKRVKSYSFHQKHFSSLLILDPMNVLIWTLFLKMVKILLALFFWHFLEQNFNLISVQCIFFFPPTFGDKDLLKKIKQWSRLMLLWIPSLQPDLDPYWHPLIFPISLNDFSKCYFRCFSALA